MNLLPPWLHVFIQEVLHYSNILALSPSSSSEEKGQFNWLVYCSVHPDSSFRHIPACKEEASGPLFLWCTIRSGAGFMGQKRWTVIWRKFSSESVSKLIGCAGKPCQQIELSSVTKLTFWSLALQSCLYLICFIIIKIEVLPNIKILSFSENRSS